MKPGDCLWSKCLKWRIFHRCTLLIRPHILYNSDASIRVGEASLMADQRNPGNLVNLLQKLQAGGDRPDLSARGGSSGPRHRQHPARVGGTASLLEENPAGDHRPLVASVRQECCDWSGPSCRCWSSCAAAMQRRLILPRRGRGLHLASDKALSGRAGFDADTGRLGRLAARCGSARTVHGADLEIPVGVCRVDRSDLRANTGGPDELERHRRRRQPRFQIRGTGYRELPGAVRQDVPLRDVLLRSYPTPWLIVAA